MKGILMSQFKFITLIACVTLVSVSSASANPWNHRYYYGYRGPVYGYPPVVVAPPPVVVAAPPPYPVPAPAYVAPAPAVYGPPVYAPPAYTYGGFGPRGFGFGYASPGFGVYFGR